LFEQGAVLVRYYPYEDLMSGAGASRLADMIRAYWRDRGYTIEVRVIDTTTTTKTGPIFCVRSNLINGLPPPDEVVPD
jgi:hypothetical protein